MDKPKPRIQVHPFVRHPRRATCSICDRPRDQHDSEYQERPAPPIDERSLPGAQ